METVQIVLDPNLESSLRAAFGGGAGVGFTLACSIGLTAWIWRMLRGVGRQSPDL